MPASHFLPFSSIRPKNNLQPVFENQVQMSVTIPYLSSKITDQRPVNTLYPLQPPLSSNFSSLELVLDF